MVASGNNDNVLVGNRTTGNARNGIWLAAVPGLPTVTGTVAAGNTMLNNGVADARDDDRSQNTWIGNRCVTQVPEDANICSGDPDSRLGASAVPPIPAAIPPVPAVDQNRWPCLKVPYFEMDPDGTGAWSALTVVAPDAPPGTYCGA